jgi:hypothetical protein
LIWKWLSCLILCCAIATGQVKPVAQASAKVGPQPTVLHASSEKLLNVPAFGFFGSPQSDADGDVFIHPAPFQEVNILKVSPSSGPIAYKLPPDRADKMSFYDFSVTPSGTVWVLANAAGSPELQAIEFDAKGEMKTPIQIQMSEQLEVNRFLVLDTGAILIAGFYTDKAPQHLRGHSLLGLFDNSGRMIRNLGDNFSPVDLATVHNAPQQGGCVAGDDGNAYIMDADKILVISPGGEITRRVVLHKPSPEALPMGLYVSKGQAAIKLATPRADHSGDASLLVIDLATGEDLGWYVLEKDAAYGDVGFSRDEGFTFFGNEQGKIKLVKAALR